MAAIIYAHHIQRRRRRVFRERVNPLDFLNDDQVMERYRLSREAITELLAVIEGDISPKSNRNHALSSLIKTLITLRYLGKGDFYSEAGDIHAVSKSSVSRCITEVITAINQRLTNISFPVTDDALLPIKQGFHRINGIPNVIGAVDGTLVPIIGPSGPDEPVYVCRKGYHALNVQAVVDHRMRFTDVVTKWPGSQHDSSIFESCSLKNDFLDRADKGWLLGDSGYPLRRYLITPKPNPNTEAEERFNNAHSKTRLVVERAFGILKSRFRCLHKSGGCLPFTPTKASKIILCCMKLHNFCIDMGMQVPEVAIVNDEDDNRLVNNGMVDASGQNIRQRLIDNFL